MWLLGREGELRTHHTQRRRMRDTGDGRNLRVARMEKWALVIAGDPWCFEMRMGLLLLHGLREVAGALSAGSRASSTARTALSAGAGLRIESALAFAAGSEFGPLVRGEGGADAE